MNRLKKELIKLHMYPASKDHISEGDAVQLEGARIRIYSDQFIRVSVYYNVVTVDYIIDAVHFNMTCRQNQTHLREILRLASSY